MHQPVRPSIKPSKYASFSVEDFIYDEYFQESVLYSVEEDKIFWNSFVKEYPQKNQELEEARAFLETIRFQENKPTQAQLVKMWKNINQATLPEAMPKRARVRSFRKIWWAAAAVALVLVGSFTLGIYLRSDRHIYTHAGEFRKVPLPDGSLITLSPNSELSFHRYFQKDSIREVWIKGEAFFSVTHLERRSKPFLAHTQYLDVRVLGTTFNINTRHQNTRVVLNTGKIEIQFRDKELSGVSLLPGEMLTYSNKHKEIKKDTVNTLPYISWKDKKFVFDNTPVKDIARKMEDYYGYKVFIKSKDLADRKITGNLTVPDAPELIDVLSTLLSIKIEKKGDTLILE